MYTSFIRLCMCIILVAGIIELKYLLLHYTHFMVCNFEYFSMVYYAQSNVKYIV